MRKIDYGSTGPGTMVLRESVTSRVGWVAIDWLYCQL
jgi:hypothetical protein